MAPAADNANRNVKASTVVFIGPKRLKLADMIASQKTSMTRNGVGIDLPLWANNNKRNCERLFAASVIWLLKPRCISVCVGRLWTVSYTHLRAHETDSYLVCRLLL